MDQTAEESIARVADAFFGAFDNRAGRCPAAADLEKLFGPGAAITKVVEGRSEVMDVASFIDPRMKLLTAGTLVDFWEWETEAQTSVLGNIASRCSVYRKAGLLLDEPFSGSGRKVIQLYFADGQWLISSVLWEDD